VVSQLERIARDLVGCLDQIPGFAAQLQRTATEMRTQAAHAAGLMRVAEQVRHRALLTLQAAGDDYAARARASHDVEKATRAMRACQVAAQVCDFAASRCDEAAHYALLAPPTARTWATSVVNGAGSRTDGALRVRRTGDLVSGPDAEPNPTQTQPETPWANADRRQAWVSEWVSRPGHRQKVRSTADWAKYQRQHAGDAEIKLIAEDGEVIWADGLTVDPDKVVAVEAKFVTNPQRSMYEGNVPDRLLDKLLRDFDQEMARYGAVIRDGANPVARLRIVTNTADAAKFLGNRARLILGASIDLDVQTKPKGE
jgi:hypothetical protein